MSQLLSSLIVDTHTKPIFVNRSNNINPQQVQADTVTGLNDLLLKLPFIATMENFKHSIMHLRSVVTKNVLLLVPVLFSSLGITGGGFQSGLGVSSSSPPSSSTTKYQQNKKLNYLL